MKSIYLHAGIHKTGSTALQGTLNLSRDILEREGIRYLSTGSDTGNHRALADALADESRFRTRIPEIWRAALDEIRDADESIAIISSENFDRLEGRGVRRLADILARADDHATVRVVIYLRPQANLLASQYNQQVKQGFRTDTLDEFMEKALRETPQWLRFRELVEHWQSAFGARVTVHVAETSHLIGHSIREDFFERIDRSDLPGKLRGPAWRNSALNTAALDGIRDIVGSGSLSSLSEAERRRLLAAFYDQWLEKAYLKRGENAEFFGGTSLPLEMLKRCRDQFAADNRWLAETCFGGRDRLDECYEEAIERAGRQDDRVAGADAAIRRRTRDSLIAFLQDKGYGELVESVAGHFPAERE